MDSKRKILFVITQGAWGGAQRYVYDLSVNLAKKCDITVAVGESDGQKDLQNKLDAWNELHQTDKIRIAQLKHLRRDISIFHDILAVFELAKLYKAVQPDVVHLNSSKTGVVGSLAKLASYITMRRRGNITVVYTVHGWVFNEPASWPKCQLYLWLEKTTAPFKNKIIVLSPQEYAVAIKIANIPADKTILIPLGIEPPSGVIKQEGARAILRKKIHIPPKPVWALTIANFYRTKGLDILIQAIASHAQQLENVSFFLIGDGPEKGNLESMINKNNLRSNVQLLGNIDDAAELLPAADIFILPSRKEGLPYTLLEAISAKIPIIAANVGGVANVIENRKTGLLIEPCDPRALAEAIIFAKANTEMMKNCAQNAFKKADDYTLDKMIENTMALYQSLFLLSQNLKNNSY